MIFVFLILDTPDYSPACRFVLRACDHLAFDSQLNKQRFLHLTWSASDSDSERNTIGFLSPLLGPSPPIAQFGQAAVVPKFFHLRIMEATVLLGFFFFLNLFLILSLFLPIW